MTRSADEVTTASVHGADRVPFRGPRMVAVALVVTTSAFALHFAAGTFVVPMSQERGWSPFALGAVMAAATAVTGFAQPVAGILLDRFGPRRVMTGASALAGAALVLSAVAEELWQFAAATVLLGATGFAGSATLAASVLVGRWYQHGRVRALAVVGAGTSAGLLTFVPTAAALVTTAGTRTAQLVLGATALLVVAPLAGSLLRDEPDATGTSRPAEDARSADPTVPTDAPEHPRATRPATSEAVERPELAGPPSPGGRTTVTTFALHAVTLYLVVLHLPRLAADLELPASTGAGLVAAAAAAALAVNLVIARTLQHRHTRPALVVLHLLRASSLVLLAVGHPATLVAGAVLFGASSFPVIPLTVALLSQGRSPAVLGRVLGPAWLLHQSAAAAGVLAAAVSRDLIGSHRPVLAAGAVAALLAAGLLTRLHLISGRPRAAHDAALSPGDRRPG